MAEFLRRLPVHFRQFGALAIPFAADTNPPHRFWPGVTNPQSHRAASRLVVLRLSYGRGLPPLAVQETS